jgi:hypothetical protein
MLAAAQGDGRTARDEAKRAVDEFAAMHAAHDRDLAARLHGEPGP